MYAIIETAGKQLKVAVGDTIVVDVPMGEPKSEVVLDKVIMVAKDSGAVFGRPYVEGVSVKAEITAIGKMPKVLVMKHVPKKAHEKLTGHRQPCTTLVIKEIIGG